MKNVLLQLKSLISKGLTFLVLNILSDSYLKALGYQKIEYGYNMGRYWVRIGGKMIAQTPGDDVWLRDEDVHRLGYVIVDQGKYWTKPPDLIIKEEEEQKRWETCAACGEPLAWHRIVYDPIARCPIIDDNRVHRAWGSSCFITPKRAPENENEAKT